MRRLAALLCFWSSLLLAVPAAADTPDARLDALIAAEMTARGIPGLQLAVVRNRRIVALRNYGVADVETRAPVTNDTIFSINSITKAFTGVAAMQMVEAGRLKLDDPVSAYLDDLPIAWRGITIRQMLSHMSGLPDINRAPTIKADDAASWAWVKAQPLAFAPGERFHYCQTNYALLMRIINRLKGTAPDTTLAGSQIKAAKMRRTAHSDARDTIAGKAIGYSLRYPVAGAPGVPEPITEIFMPISRASSGMHSTARDMAQWIIAIQKHRLLKPASLDAMWSRVAFSNGQPGQWGLGWITLPRGTHRTVGMTGGGRSALFLYPEDDMAVVILTNLAGGAPEDIADEVAAIYNPDYRLTGVPALRAALRTRGYDDALAVVAELTHADPAFSADEAELNDWGYRLLTNHKPKEALAVFQVAVGLYPQSANAYDSVADAYEANGDTARAIANYRRSLVLDPKNGNAVQRLKKLETPAVSAP